MWYGEGNLPAARTWFDASRRRVPAYAPALGHLAEIDTALGAHQAAIDRLRLCRAKTRCGSVARGFSGWVRRLVGTR
jgi:hypothetical protein